MAAEVSHPRRVEHTPEQRPEPAPADIEQALGAAELRTSVLTRYAPETLRAHRKRVAHYQAWCSANGFQTGAEHITAELVEAYVQAQCATWELRPNTLRQAARALKVLSEQVQGRAVDTSQALRMIDLAQQKAPVEPAYRVGRKVTRPKRGRRTSAE